MSVTRFILTSPLAAGLVLSACGGSNERFAQKIEVVQGLRLQKVQSQLVADEIEAPGNVIAASTAQVAARTMGAVLQVAVREGDTVKRGQLLAQLDERELSAHRAAARRPPNARLPVWRKPPKL